MNKKKLLKIGFLFLCIVVIIILPSLSLFDFQRQLYQTMEDFSYDLLQQSSEQKMDVVLAKIDAQFDVLESTATYLGSSGHIADDSVVKVLDSLKQSGKFHRAWMADARGNAMATDHTTINVWDEPAFQKALKGQKAIALSYEADRESIVLAVPVFQNDMVNGILAVEYQPEILSQLIFPDEDDLNDQSFIINPSGKIILWGNIDVSIPISSDNLFEIWDSLGTSQSNIQKMRKDLSQNYSGYIEIFSLSTLPNRLIVYTPLGMNDWFLINSIPLSITENLTVKIQDYVAVLTIKLALIFAIILIYVLYNNRKQKKVLLKEKEHFRLSEERYRIIAELSNNIIWEKNLDTGVCHFFGHYEDLFGRPPITTHFPEDSIQAGDIHPEDAAVVRRLFAKARDNGIGGQAEIRLHSSNGQYLWCFCQVQPILGEDGRPYRLIGNIVNIDCQKKQTDSLIEKAQTDSLTGLYNRRAIREQIELHLQQKSNDLCALFLLDIDHFKQINDTFGHVAGDRSLILLSRQLKKLYQKEPLIGRIGGDEFVLFFSDLHSPDDAARYANTVRNILNQDFVVEGKPYPITVSIGITIYQNSSYLSFEELYRQADQALYEAKKAGRNCFRFYMPH